MLQHPFQSLRLFRLSSRCRLQGNKSHPTLTSWEVFSSTCQQRHHKQQPLIPCSLMCLEWHRPYPKPLFRCFPLPGSRDRMLQQCLGQLFMASSNFRSRPCHLRLVTSQNQQVCWTLVIWHFRAPLVESLLRVSNQLPSM